MKHIVRLRNRRMLLQAGLGIFLSPSFGRAAGLTGIEVLDTAPIHVKRPDGVLLVAITRAGSRLVAVGEYGVIIYSDDNGTTWAQACVPVTVTLTCVAFATPMLGWAAGHFGVILVTTDGGEHWLSQLNGITANLLTMAAAQAATTQNSAVPGAPLALRRANAFTQQGPAIPFLTLLVLTPKKVIVFGAYRMTMVTTDGGQTWSDWSLHIFDPLSHNIYGSTQIGSDLYIAGEMGLVFCSTDDGDSFLPVAPTSDITLFGVLGPRDGSVLVFGVAGASFRSTDRCKTWVPITLPTQDDLTAGSVLHSGEIMFASETGTIFVSEDNGASFKVVSGVAPVPIFDVVEAPNNELVVVGSTGVSSISPALLNT